MQVSAAFSLRSTVAIVLSTWVLSCSSAQRMPRDALLLRALTEGEPQANEPARAVVAFAARQVGKPYCWGGTGPHCFDCSGLAGSAWSVAGAKLPRTSWEIAANLPEVALQQVQAGDILWWPGHVGIYAGNGWVIDALDRRHGVVLRPASDPYRAFRPSTYQSRVLPSALAVAKPAPARNPLVASALAPNKPLAGPTSPTGKSSLLMGPRHTGNVALAVPTPAAPQAVVEQPLVQQPGSLPEYPIEWVPSGEHARKPAAQSPRATPGEQMEHRETAAAARASLPRLTKDEPRSQTPRKRQEHTPNPKRARTRAGTKALASTPRGKHAPNKKPR